MASFVFIRLYGLCQDDITASVTGNPFENKYYFTCSLLLRTVFNPPIPTHWHGPRLLLVNDLKKSPSIQFCGSSSSIVSTDVVRITHSMAAQRWLLLFVRLPIVILFVSALVDLHTRYFNTSSSCPLPFYTSSNIQPPN
jgi:hypothetical protein